MDELLKQLSDIDSKLDGLLANDTLTAEQQAEHDALVAKRASVLKGIDARKAADVRAEERSKLEDEAALAAKAKAERERKAKAGLGRKTEADVPRVHGATRYDDQGRVTATMETSDEEVSLQFSESSGRKIRTYGEQRRRNDRFLRRSGYQEWGEFKSLQDFVRTGLQSHQTNGFRDKHAQHFAAVQGMSEGVGADGGYLVMPEFSNRILDRVYSNDLWSRTDNYTVTGNSMTFLANSETSRANGSRHGGLRGYWLGEGQTKTPSKPGLRSITLKLVKLAVVVYLTDELLEDTGNVLSDYVARKASEEFNFLIGDALVNGTGVGQPLGLLNWPSLVSVAKESGQPADTVWTENIVKMFSRFYGPNRGNMIWLHNQDVEPQLFTMTLGVGTGGVVTYMPPGGLSSAPYATLMGRPSLATEFNPTLGDQGDILACDLGQMISISKGGIAQAVSMHVEFLTDQTALRFVMRLNAGPWESAPLTPYKGSATQSNAVVIDPR